MANPYRDEVLDPTAFSQEVRRATHDLADLVGLVGRTRSTRLESTHLLMALAQVGEGETQEELRRLGITVTQWQNGLARCAMPPADTMPLVRLEPARMDETAQRALDAAARYAKRSKRDAIDEPVLLLAALENATDRVRRLFTDIQIDVGRWVDVLRGIIEGEEADPFNPDHQSPSGKKVLRSMQGEAEAMGYSTMDPRHLLLGLLAYEGGATHYCLHHQERVPRKVQEGVMLNLRARARRTPTKLSLDAAHVELILKDILDAAGAYAGQDRRRRVAEADLWRALLDFECGARHILEDEGLNVAKLRQMAAAYEVPPEEEEGEATIADIDTARTRLQERLVGQEEAIESILPYVQRMRFGFNTPGRPVGVFLFCGQSGSGKTEMAKGLAQAVYGSEENLIFLEMGQFNAAESMNIFVGAPPGYVGYGEGKLTNGLRDKPRAVVLFDEVEKAHARVLDALLRFLDEGRIDDPAGPVRDGSQCIVVLTSNVGATELGRLSAEVRDRPDERSLVRTRLREIFARHHFRVEFLNRVDELILFRRLEVQDYTEIARRLLQRDLRRLLEERQIAVTVDPALERAIGRYCSFIEEGARAAQRLTQTTVITPVIDYVLRNRLPFPASVQVRLRSGGEAREAVVPVREAAPPAANAAGPGTGQFVPPCMRGQEPPPPAPEAPAAATRTVAIVDEPVSEVFSAVEREGQR